jgi:DNA modification methylase
MADSMADSMAPMTAADRQLPSAASASDEDRRNCIVCSDNLTLLQRLPDEHCGLIYVDPPFMTNLVRSQADGLYYDDRWRGGVAEFLAFLSPRLRQMHRVLNASGTLYVHLDWRVSHHVRMLLDEVFGAAQFLNEIIWSYRTGGRSTRWFARKHDTILVYAKQFGGHTFNLQRGGSFRTDGLIWDDDGRPYKNTTNGRLYFHADGPALTDVWEIPFLSTVSNERTGYPTQKPEKLLDRIVQASSNPGDLVADFFCGSGTTPAVARRLGRDYLGCDSSEEAVRIARRRLEGD